jgi:aquaporin Z
MIGALALACSNPDTEGSQRYTMRKYLVEFIGTFFLVLTFGCTVLSGLPYAPLAIGAAFTVMIYAGGHISGGHFNPAISLAAFLRGQLAKADLRVYWLVQLIAGLLAALMAKYLINPSGVHAMPLSGHDMWAALIGEFLFTFALCYVVLNVATSTINSFGGLAAGFTVLAGGFAVGEMSGGAFNPAVAFGATAIGLFSWGNIWIYLIAELLAAVAAARAYLYLSLGEGQ